MNFLQKVIVFGEKNPNGCGSGISSIPPDHLSDEQKLMSATNISLPPNTALRISQKLISLRQGTNKSQEDILKALNAFIKDQYPGKDKSNFQEWDADKLKKFDDWNKQGRPTSLRKESR